MTKKPLRIGTRDSVLATWQARYVSDVLKEAGYPTELIYIKTEGDRVLDTPLPLMGGKGVFTKALDDALMDGTVDIAVHSLKDIPTRQPQDLIIAAVTKREDTRDVLVTRKSALRERSSAHDGREIVDSDTKNTGNDAGKKRYDAMMTQGGATTDLKGSNAVIASSSNRRIGQWLAHYPEHRMVDIRGNIQTRLQKLVKSNWDGAIFAAAGLRRLGLEHHIDHVLDWMLPAPGQGAMGVMIREDDPYAKEAVRNVHDEHSALCTQIERDVLHTLEGGCSAPVGALAKIGGDDVQLYVNAVYPDGRGMIAFEMTSHRDEAADLGKRAASEALKRGADLLIRDINNSDSS